MVDMSGAEVAREGVMDRMAEGMVMIMVVGTIEVAQEAEVGMGMRGLTVAI